MSELKPKVRKVVVIHDTPNQFVGYANINGITVTPEEAIMHLGLRRPDEPDVADGVAKIYLSLPHLKRIMLVLTEIVRDHEIYFGEIQVDADERLTEEGRRRILEQLKEQKDAGTE